MTSKTPAKKKDTELSTDVIDFSEDANSGFEEADADAFSIPFLRIVQTNSPQCNRADSAYIDGAQSGMLLNMATGELMETADVIPCHYRRVFVEWRPLDQGGGFVKEHTAAEGAELAETLDAEWRLPNGNELTDTRMHYCIDAVDGDPLVVAMSSSQLKKSRGWMNVMRHLKVTKSDGTKVNPPMFSSVFRLSTVPEKNDKGSWFGWKIQRVGDVQSRGLYIAAKEFRDVVMAGKAEVKHDQAEETSEEHF